MQSSGTWTVTADLSDNQTLGIALFSIDVLGTSGAGVTIQKANPIFQTLAVPNPPYSLFRNTGTINTPNLTGITSGQDWIDAANNFDPTVLRFGDGLLADAISPIYGTIMHGGTLALARGRWTASGAGGTIQATITPSASLQLFPLNFAVDDGEFGPPPVGTVQTPTAALHVFASNIVNITPVPEPGSIILMALAALGALTGRRCD